MNSNEVDLRFLKAGELIDRMRKYTDELKKTRDELNVMVSGLEKEIVGFDRKLTALNGKRTAERIIECVALAVMFPVSNRIFRRSNQLDITRSRAITFFLVNKYTQLTGGEMGRLREADFSHSTVSHSLKTMNDAIETFERTKKDPQNWVGLMNEAERIFIARIESKYYDEN